MRSLTTSTSCCFPIWLCRSKRYPFSTRFPLVTHQILSDWTQTDLRRPHNLNPSPTWRRIWICCSSSRTWEPPLVGDPVSDIHSDSNKVYSSRSTTPSSRSREGLGDEGATAHRAAPAFENHSQPDGHTDSFLGSHIDLTITSMPQGRVGYWKGFEPSELLDYESRLVAFTQELSIRRADLSLPSRKREKVAQSYSSTALQLTTRRIVKSSWPPFAIWRTTSWTPNRTTSNSWTS
jgi:hypothetical protein